MLYNFLHRIFTSQNTDIWVKQSLINNKNLGFLLLVRIERMAFTLSFRFLVNIGLWTRINGYLVVLFYSLFLSTKQKRYYFLTQILYMSNFWQWYYFVSYWISLLLMISRSLTRGMIISYLEQDMCSRTSIRRLGPLPFILHK